MNLSCSIIFQEPDQTQAHFAWIPQLALPYDKHPPTVAPKLADMLLVIGHVAGEFFAPELPVGLGRRGDLASSVSMPEAAMNKDDRPMPGQDDVGLAGQRTIMKPEPEAGLVQQGPHDEFRLGVLALDQGHATTAFFFCKNIHHRNTIGYFISQDSYTDF